MKYAADLVLLVPLLLVYLANLGESREWARIVTLIFLGAAILGVFLAGIGSVLLGASGVLAGTVSGVAAGVPLLIAAGLSLALLFEPVRAPLARLMPIRPASIVHTTALVLSVLLIGLQVATQLGTDVLAAAAKGPALTSLDLLLQELPFLLAAIIGVGFFTRRGIGEGARRLGWVRPSLLQVLLALVAAGAFYAFSNGADQVGQHLTPGLHDKVGVATQRLFGGLSNPLGIATLALSAGIAEEALFRGALQPRLGIPFVALLFTSVHSQYGISLDALTVFILAIGLGLIRRYANTTASTICHVTYNALVGVSLAGVYLAAGIAVEALLALALLFFYLRARRRPLVAAPVAAEEARN